ncbi:MAG: SH3 domain-containing protein [Anaerolineales bacterium]
MIDFIKAAGFPAVALLIGGGMVLLAIIKNIALEKVKIQLTPAQSTQLAVVGALFIVGGFILQYFPPSSTSSTIVKETSEVNPTLSFLETQLAQMTASPSITEQVSIPPEPTITPTTSLSLSTIITSNQTQTPTPLLPTGTSSVEVSTELFCANFYSIMVRDGPNENYPLHSILENLNNLSNPDCLLFDYRMPDNSWIRIAPNQEKEEYGQHELGWVAAEQFRPLDFEKLQVYIPESVQKGLYCVTNRYGLNVRTCPNNSCNAVGTLQIQDCVIIDARSIDNQWVRISGNQSEDKYAPLEGNWVSSYFLAPVEFTAGYLPYFRYYFELLPAVNMAPTPEG